MWKSHKGNSKVIGSMEHGSFEEKMTSLAPTLNYCDIESSELKNKIFSSNSYLKGRTPFSLNPNSGGKFRK